MKFEHFLHCNFENNWFKVMLLHYIVPAILNALVTSLNSPYLHAEPKENVHFFFL